MSRRSRKRYQSAGFVELLQKYETPVGEPPRRYEARAYGELDRDGHWHGWLAFFPMGGGRVLVTLQETSQPSLESVHYWAAGLTPVYLEGALRRAVLAQPQVVAARVAALLDAQRAVARSEERLAVEAARARNDLASAHRRIRRALASR